MKQYSVVDLVAKGMGMGAGNILGRSHFGVLVGSHSGVLVGWPGVNGACWSVRAQVQVKQYNVFDLVAIYLHLYTRAYRRQDGHVSARL